MKKNGVKCWDKHRRTQDDRYIAVCVTRNGGAEWKETTRTQNGTWGGLSDVISCPQHTQSASQHHYPPIQNISMVTTGTTGGPIEVPESFFCDALHRDTRQQRSPEKLAQNLREWKGTFMLCLMTTTDTWTILWYVAPMWRGVALFHKVALIHVCLDRIVWKWENISAL